MFGRDKKKENTELHWHKVKSSFVEAVAYDAANKELYVTLSHGSYKYENVSSPIFEEFLLASSKGTFFNAKIRDAYTVTSR